MDIRFKRPVYVNEEVFIRGKILEVRGKKVILTARCIDRMGKERATAQGLFIRV